MLPVDVADADAVEAAAERVERELGPIDVWVNNAMVSVFSPVKELTADEVKRVTEVTYLGVVYGTLAALKRMLPRDRGAIVQVGSALAYRGIPLQAAYCGAKHAIQGFTESLRCELLHDRSHVHVTMVQLPAMNTPQFDWVKSRLPRKPQPVPPIYAPEIAADAIVWAAIAPAARDQRRRADRIAIWAQQDRRGLAIAISRDRLRLAADRRAGRSAAAEQPVAAAAGRPRTARPLRRSRDASSPQTWINERLPAVAMLAAAARIVVGSGEMAKRVTGLGGRHRRGAGIVAGAIGGLVVTWAMSDSRRRGRKAAGDATIRMVDAQSYAAHLAYGVTTESSAGAYAARRRTSNART